MRIECAGTVGSIEDAPGVFLPTCSEDWTAAAGLLPSLTIEEGVVIATAILGLFAVAWGWRVLQRVL